MRQGARVINAEGGTKPSTGNRVLSNAVCNNAQGIDLDGGTLNDRKDPDAGPTTLQNFPLLTSVETPEGGRIFLEGILVSTPCTRNKKNGFTIQFFSSPRNENEGETFLGQTRVTTNRQGRVSFSFELTRPLLSGGRITATATGPGGNLSESSDPLALGFRL